MGKPVVSFIMPAYNSIKYLDASVLSVLSDRYSNWELLAYDDRSDDGTYERLLFWASQDKRIKVSRPFDKHGHYIEICNLLLNDAHGKYIARIDADDITLPNRLKIELDFFENNTNVTLVGAMGLAVMEDNDGKLSDSFPWIKELIEPIASYENPINKHLLTYNRIIHSTLLAKKDDMLSVGGYDNLDPSEDWDMALSLSEIGDVYILPEVLCLKRQHPRNYCKQHPNRKPAFEAVKKKHQLKIDNLPNTKDFKSIK